MSCSTEGGRAPDRSGRGRDMSMRRRIGGHVRLLRLPLAATTAADVWAGYVITHAPRGPLGDAAPPLSIGELLALHAVALCMYGAGMTLNDAFDAPRDETLHPDRPIPAGVVSTIAAYTQGALLLVLGLAIAAAIGPASFRVAALMAGAIVLYDAGLKRWAIPSALAMGAVRYLDVQLGAGFAAGPAFSPAVALGLYVAGVTWFSTLEERPEQGRRITIGIGYVVLVLMAEGLRLPHYLMASWLYALAAALIAFAGMRAVHRASTASVRALVLVGLLGIFLVDAGSLLGWGHWPWAMATLLLSATFPPLVHLQSRLVAPAGQRASGGTETEVSS
ncbi:MAG: hypothetical protein D6776_02440 [Planctomycetota bacterium]|nr:MAG: hypothetical protein D6776_02440 [Planctomycetota bacterium]